MSAAEAVLQYLTSSPFLAASAIFIVGLISGYLLGEFVRRALRALGLPGVVEGTAFERSARGLGTSTVGLLSQLVAFSVYLGATIAALDVAGLLVMAAVLPFFAAFLPQVFIAVLAVIAGLVVGDKAALLVSEHLRGVKLPEAGLIPTLVKYSIFYIAALIALNQLGVATRALLILLAAYVFGIIFLGGIAFRDLLSAGAAGVYLLLNEPYSIGDEIRVGERTGIVQEVDLFVTHVEDDGTEYIIPNQQILRDGIVRIRD
ncbi:mechanosensitive ion channel protein MscS [Halorientalis sp. IM1011]|uniref:mechanosensitive ion channel domain-containing protein n=1 Tax=Halorientalis sp. IM1011 TaxID=1932360 RepID=UPI00097CC796|nr:mechanosensitive ion channel domain-containing protein [Halorientalis sp. IM1011]AQL44209.1 mechanosensitive ion channel protein MscS [Halorientalis sp. IM1011]